MRRIRIRINILTQSFWLLAALLLLVPQSTLAGAGQPSAPEGAEFSDNGTQREKEEPTGVLSLRDAVTAALQRNPDLAIFSWEVRAREARAVQAGLFPNPAVNVEVENVGGSGDRESFEQTETTVWLSQLIELAGKRGKRRQLADLQGDLAEWDYEVRRLGVLTQTTKAFAATLAAQARVDLVEELESLAGTSVRSIGARVQAGAVPAVERTRAQVVLLRAELESQRAKRDLAASRTSLAATWGSHRPVFSEARGDLAAGITAPPPLSELQHRILGNPDIARWETELAAREASISLQRSRAFPDPSVLLGGRHFSDNGDNALVFAFSVPLPVFDRNQGAVLAARRDLAKAAAGKHSAQVTIRSALAARYQNLAVAFEQAQALRERALPAAEAAFEGTRDGYRKGFFRYLDVIHSQRTLFELRAQELAALLAYHQARADIERMIAAPLEDRAAPRGQP